MFLYKILNFFMISAVMNIERIYARTITVTDFTRKSPRFQML